MRKLLWGIVLTCFWLGVNPALAQGPTEYIRGILDRVMAIQNNDSLSREARGQAIHQIVSSSFDFNAMAKDVLGGTFDQLSSSQRGEFIDTFRYLFQDSYTRLVLNFLKQENIEYGKATQGGGKAKVDTVIKRPNENIPVTYLMHSTSGWKLYDVVVDGVSILSTYRSQFGNVIKTKSFNYLIDKMKQQRRSVD
ncbi:MAG: MlaC/ttg2D family ABC transporter substrate-binding protein [Desulfobaccales bacterium]